MGKTYIIGCEGSALNIIEQITDAYGRFGGISLSGIIIDTYEKGEIIAGLEVVGGLKDISVLLKDESANFIFALFKPEKMKDRHLLLKSLSIPSSRLCTFIDPGAWVSPSAKIGNGTVILSGASVNSNVVLGESCMIYSSVVIEHETTIGDAFYAAAGAIIGAKVKVGDHCFIGLNSSVRENTILGDNVFIGMHSLVTRNFSDCRVKGVPARKF